jgi:protein involved in polysaccharide export with SLBB domain
MGRNFTVGTPLFVGLLGGLLAVAACAGNPPPASPQQPAAAPTPGAEVANLPYRLQRDDVVEVRLAYTPEFNVTQPIRSDGRISLELIGEVEAAGLTPSELRDLLIARYSTILREPTVSVILAKSAGQRVYVGGEVASPGMIPIEGGGGLTALRAIVRAGGFRNTGASSNVVILRDQQSAEPLFLTLDLAADLKGAAGHDIVLRPNDIVFVPKTRIAKIGQFVDQYIRQLIPVTLSLGVSYYVGVP